MCRELVPIGAPLALVWKYAFCLGAGTLRPDEAILREVDELLDSPKNAVTTCRWSAPASCAALCCRSAEDRIEVAGSAFW